MDKVALLSIVVAAIVVPAIGARLADPRQGLRFTLSAMAAGSVLYVFIVYYIFPRLLGR